AASRLLLPPFDGVSPQPLLPSSLPQLSIMVVPLPLLPLGWGLRPRPVSSIRLTAFDRCWSSTLFCNRHRQPLTKIRGS
ncbi:unnamed protein product, partial [Citrullus colocynthis]